MSSLLSPITQPFSSLESQQRLKRVQQLIATQDLDGLLVIAGPDSQNNSLCNALVKYLFLGLSGREVQQEQLFFGRHEVLEDTVMLIGPQEVRIFYDARASSYLHPFLSSWPNVLEWTLSGSEAQDEDLSQSIKIRSFLDMLQGLEAIGVTAGPDGMAVEKWPLIQTFGLQSIQNKGFFTMNHKVKDVSEAVTELFRQSDAFYLRSLLSGGLPGLERPWKEMIHLLDAAKSPEDRGALSEQDLGDPIITAYEFGQIRQATFATKADGTRGSRVFFGIRTNLLFQDSGALKVEDSSDSASIATAGVGGGPALHGTFEGEDPYYGLRAARSYFFSYGKLPSLSLEGVAAQSYETKHFQLLTELYRATCKAVSAAGLAYASLFKAAPLFSRTVLHVVEDAAQRAMKEEIASAIKAGKNELLGSVTPQFLESNMNIVVSRVNAAGQDVDHSYRGRKLVYIRVTLGNIPTLEDSLSSPYLGAVTCGDTFFVPSNGVGSLNLTAHIPVVGRWSTLPLEGQIAKALEKQYVNYGHQQNTFKLGRGLGSAINGVHILLDSEDMPHATGSLLPFETGFVFVCPSFAPMIVSFAKDTDNLQVYNVSLSAPGTSSGVDGATMVLYVEYKAKDNNPTTEVTGGVTRAAGVAIPFVPDTTAFRRLLDVLPEWRANAKLNGITYELDRDIHPGRLPSPRLVAAFSTLFGLGRKEDQESLIGRAFIEDVQEISGVKIDEQSATADETASSKTPLTVFLGLPGSDAAMLADGLMDITSASISWTRVTVDGLSKSTTGDGYHPDDVRESLRKGIEALSGSKTSSIPQRLLLSVTGFFDPVDVLGLVLCDPYLKERLHIFSVVTNISASSLYRDPRQSSLLPRLLDQCQRGWCDVVVITKGDMLSEDEFATMKKRVHEANPEAELICFRSDVIEGSTGLMTRDSFHSNAKEQLRRILYAGFNKVVPKSKFAVDVKWAGAGGAVKTLVLKKAGLFDRTRLLAYLTALTPKARVISSLPPTGRREGERPSIVPKSDGTKPVGALRLMQQLAEMKVQEELRPSAPVEPAVASKAATVEKVGKCWVLRAYVRLTEDPQHWVEVQSSQRLVTVRRASPPEECHQNKESIFAFVGESLLLDGVEMLIAECRPEYKTKRQPRTLSSITPEEKHKIAQAVMGLPIPEGYFYDGRMYVDQYGVGREEHPAITEYCETYLEEENEKIREENKRIDEENSRIKLSMS